MRWPWRTEPLPPLEEDVEALERLDKAVEETSYWQRLARGLIIQVGFDLNERYEDVAHLER